MGYHDYHLSLMRPTQLKYSRKNIMSDYPSGNTTSTDKNKGKMKQKIYIIKENKVINSITRVNDQEIKQQLEREIQNRTSTLKKCQNILSKMGSQDRTGGGLNGMLGYGSEKSSGKILTEHLSPRQKSRQKEKEVHIG